MDVKDMDDEYVMLAQLEMEGLSEGHVPGEILGRILSCFTTHSQMVSRYGISQGCRKVQAVRREYDIQTVRRCDTSYGECFHFNLSCHIVHEPRII